MTGFARRTARAAVAAVALGVLALGCGKGDGKRVYRVSGAVTFDGRPVPTGIIIFSPDVAKKNDGPQGSAEIRDGRYDTDWTGKGVAGGPMTITVGGTTADGKPLCKYEFAADLPREDTTKDIPVPKSAATRGAAAEGP
jgi:hypothetical protein